MRRMTGVCMFMAILFYTSVSATENNQAEEQRIEKVNQLLRLGESNLLRGLRFNMSREEVLSKESGSGETIDLIDSVVVHLASATAGLPDYAMVTYYFNETGLFRVVFKSFQLNEEAAMLHYYSAKNLLERHYGNRYSDDYGYAFWKASDTKSGVPFIVTTSDIPDSKHPGFAIEYVCKK